MDTEELSYLLVKRLQENYAKELMTRYKLEEVCEDPYDTLSAIARKRGCLMSGGRINYDRIATILLDEFRGGVIGNISLERPDDILVKGEN